MESPEPERAAWREREHPLKDPLDRFSFERFRQDDGHGDGDRPYGPGGSIAQAARDRLSTD